MNEGTTQAWTKPCMTWLTELYAKDPEEHVRNGMPLNQAKTTPRMLWAPCLLIVLRIDLLIVYQFLPATSYFCSLHCMMQIEVDVICQWLSSSLLPPVTNQNLILPYPSMFSLITTNSLPAPGVRILIAVAWSTIWQFNHVVRSARQYLNIYLKKKRQYLNLAGNRSRDDQNNRYTNSTKPAAHSISW